MSPVRRGLVLAVLGGLIAAHGFDVATGREHWPISPYPMYSRVELDRTTTKLQIEGVPADPSAAPVALWRGEAIEPFDMTRLNSAMRRIGDDRQRLRRAVLDVARRYERRRRAGELEGPEIDSARLWERSWEVRSDLANRDRPDAERLVLEVSP